MDASDFTSKHSVGAKTTELEPPQPQAVGLTPNERTKYQEFIKPLTLEDPVPQEHTQSLICEWTSINNTPLLKAKLEIKNSGDAVLKALPALIILIKRIRLNSKLNETDDKNIAYLLTQPKSDYYNTALSALDICNKHTNLFKPEDIIIINKAKELCRKHTSNRSYIAGTIQLFYQFELKISQAQKDSNQPNAKQLKDLQDSARQAQKDAEELLNTDIDKQVNTII